jgi:diguanylate cyclase (GGDEF)-like protein
VAADAEQRIAEQQRRIRYLEGLSITDELTGLLNRRGFNLEMERALARAERSGECGLLLLCDLNHFKAVNDTYGHLAGDAVLYAVAKLLRRHTRRSDYAGRLGGDEFAILMTDTNPRQAQERVEKLVGWVNQLQVAWENISIPVSMAYGVENYGRNSDPECLYALADRALYRDKQQRDRRVVCLTGSRASRDR